MQALPPRHVYSATVTNKTGNDVHVKAVYAMPDNASTEHAGTAAANGGTFALPQKLVEKGTYTATGNIASVEVSGSDGTVLAAIAAPFGVHSPTKDYHFTVVAAEDGSIAIREGAH